MFILKKAIKYDPNCARAHFNLAMVLSEPKVLSVEPERINEAKAEYEKVIEIDPSDAGAHYNLGLLLFYMGDLKGANSMYEKAAGLDPCEERYANLKKLLEEADAPAP